MDHMITVEILDKNDDMQTESDNDRVDLDIGVAVSLPRPVNWIKKNSEANNTNLSTSRQEIDHLLHCTGAVHVQGDVDQVLSDGLADEVPLLVRGVLEELLAEVVAEGVCVAVRLNSTKSEMK